VVLGLGDSDGVGDASGLGDSDGVGDASGLGDPGLGESDGVAEVEGLDRARAAGSAHATTSKWAMSTGVPTASVGRGTLRQPPPALQPTQPPVPFALCTG
jgi:hypothetical protein